MEEAQHDYSVDDENNYRPYPSKIVCEISFICYFSLKYWWSHCQFMLLDIIDNLPRLWLSNSHLRLILWVLNECGLDAPSFKAFREVQEGLRTEIFPEVTKPFTSGTGNHFYVNDIAESIGHVRDPLIMDSQIIYWQQLIGLFEPCNCTTSPFLPRGDPRCNFWGLAGTMMDRVLTIGVNTYVLTWIPTILHWRGYRIR